MDEDQITLLREFLSEHWALWESHCEVRNEDPNSVYVEVLGGDE